MPSANADDVPRRYIGYYRVSTRKQGKSGLGLEGQRLAVLGFLEKNQPARLVAEFTEVESGRKSDLERPQLAAALSLSRRKKATLIVARIDRLGRNVALIARLLESGADFVAADLPIADRMTIHIIAAVAEYEADLIAARRRDALASARAQGRKLGMAARTPEERAHMLRRANAALAERRLRHARETMPHILELRRRGISNYEPLAKALNAAGVRTFSGKGRWWPDAVKAVIRTVEPGYRVKRPPLTAKAKAKMLAAAIPVNIAAADARALVLRRC